MSKSPYPDWKKFEQFVAEIEQALRNMPGVTVTHDAKQPACYGVERQIDVLIKYDTGVFSKTIAVECKNIASKVSIEVVDAFASKLKSIGADEGIIVAANGFQTGALKAAVHYGIKTFQLSEATAIMEYLQSYPLFPFEIKQEVLEIHAGFNYVSPVNDLFQTKSELWFEGLNAALTIDELLRLCLHQRQPELSRAMFQSVLDPGKSQLLVGTNEIVLHFPSPMLFYCDNQQTEVSGFRALIKTTLITGPATLERVSVYQDSQQTEPTTIIYEMTMEQGNLDFICANWTVQNNSSTIILFK
ncbi:MAG: hypothetical protein BGO54_13855 [Sphingobacteriales bacterium 46-32]|nr:MAG: hypothetical protein BGO54_13855 [Sphingobacteriales bacterium 46-32]